MREISREYTFEAAHRLDHLPTTHKCHRLHGHSYRVRVSIAGPVDPEFVWILDFAVLDEIWRKQVHDRADHRYLNEVDGIGVTTAENLVEWIHVQLAKGLPEGVFVSRIELNEGLGGGQCVKTIELR